MELNFKEEEPAITNFYYSVPEDQVRTHLNDSKARITESKTEGRLNLDEREVLEDELCYLKDLLEKAQGRESSTRSYIEQPQVQTEVIQGLNFEEEDQANVNFCLSVLEHQVRTHLKDNKARLTESKTEGRLNLDVQEDLLVCYLDEREVLEDEIQHLKELLGNTQGRESSTQSYTENLQVQTEVIQDLNFEEEEPTNVNFFYSVLEHQLRTHLKDSKARLTESKTEGRLNLDVQEDLLVCYLDEREVLEDELYHLLDLLEKAQGRQSSTRSYTDKSQVQTDVQQDLLACRKGDTFSCESGEYVIQAFLGEGSFGKVAKCLNLRNNETVAIKIHKSHLSNDDIEQEVAMLQALRAVDPDKNNLVRFIDSFDCQNCYCLAFEMLDKSLWDLMMDRRLTPLTLNEIRPITQQLLVAFHALKGLGIIHTDLKADNIMLVNHQDQPFKVKLIDFGLALPASKARIGMTMQIRSFRAPEVFLGLPISEAIDMWGLGCVMAFLYFSNYLFSHSSSYKTMKDICQMLGQPEDHLLNAGTKASHYFIKKVDSNNLEWRLMTAVENEHAKNPGDTGDDSEDDCYMRSVAERYRDFNLDGAVKAYMTIEDARGSYEDGMEFLDFQKRLLHLDGERRLTPIQALQHNFITLAHLKDHSSTSYAEQAHEFMSVCTSFDYYYSVLEDQLRTHLKDSKARLTESKTEGRLNLDVQEDLLACYLDDREVLENEIQHLKELLGNTQGRQSSALSYTEKPQVQTEVIQGLNFEEEDQANVNFFYSVLEHQLRTHLKDSKARITESKTEGRLNLNVQEDLLVCYLDEREVLEDEIQHLKDLLEKAQGRESSTRSYMEQPQVQTDVIQDLQLILKDLKGETEVLQKELEAVKSVTATPQDSHQTQPEKDACAQVLETERLPFHQEKTSLLEELNNLKNETNILLAALKKNREELKNGQKSRDCMKAQLEETECQFFQKKKKKLVQMILLS